MYSEGVARGVFSLTLIPFYFWYAKKILGEQTSNVGFIIEHTLITSTDERLRCFLLYADNNKDLSRKNSYIKPADIVD